MSHSHPFGRLILTLAAAAVVPGAAYADVTVQQQSIFDLAVIKMHMSTTELTSTDKQRRDSEVRCDGFMSLLCGNGQNGDIVRLDKDVNWSLDPKKKQYRETAFPTPAQRQVAAQQAQVLMEKMKSCPVPRNTTAAPDTSKCQMSPPSLEIKTTDNHASFIGHDSKLTEIVLTQSCRNASTGDECNMAFYLDTWLSQDAIPGMDERKAFQLEYLKKMGLDDRDGMMQKQLQQFLAPYADALKQLQSKSGEIKGYPLKSVFRVAFGGDRCSAAKQSQQSASASGSSSGSVVGDASQAAGNAAAGSAASSAGSAAGQAAGNAVGNNAGGSILGSAASAFGSKLASGLFKKKTTPPPAATDANANATAASSTALPAGMVQAASISIETTSISVGPVAASQFEIPADWKQLIPKPHETKEFSCPKTES